VSDTAGTWIQLWVEPLAADPASFTALHALQMLMGKDAPVKVGRADLWELHVVPKPGESDEGIADRFETWMRASNLFVNPNRDRGVVLDGVAPLPAPTVALVVVGDLAGSESRAHAITLGHALGGTWRARKGAVWSLAWPTEREDDLPALADRAAYARRRSSGLLVNEQSQGATVLVGRWVCPVLPGSAPADRSAAAEVEGDGRVA
jgi:hypothetical protein